MFNEKPNAECKGGVSSRKTCAAHAFAISKEGKEAKRLIRGLFLDSVDELAKDQWASAGFKACVLFLINMLSFGRTWLESKRRLSRVLTPECWQVLR